MPFSHGSRGGGSGHPDQMTVLGAQSPSIHASETRELS
jgi:hypothetical protein